MRHTLLMVLFLLLSTTTYNAFAVNLYGAIAYSLAEGKYGYAKNYKSRAGAQSAALAACNARLRHTNNRCNIEVWFKNGYGALAVGRDGFGTGWGDQKRTAQLHALNICRKYTSDCTIRVVVQSK